MKNADESALSASSRYDSQEVIVLVINRYIFGGNCCISDWQALVSNCSFFTAGCQHNLQSSVDYQREAHQCSAKDVVDSANDIVSQD